MATAGLQEGIAQDLVVNCGGGKTFYGRFFKCWIAATMARMARSDISKAIYQSCDSYFYTLAEKLGISRIAKYATMLGLGQKTGIDLPQEVSGVMPSEEWKIKNFKQKWYAGETISVGIGQGAVATTPIQLARALGAITSGGCWSVRIVAFPDQFPPGFKQVSPTTESPAFLSTRITGSPSPMPWRTSCRQSERRAARACPGIDFAGKTGSAQTVSNQLKKKMSAREKSQFKDNGWFVGVTPRRNPEIVVACLFEGGEHGALAARSRDQGHQPPTLRSSARGRRWLPRLTLQLSPEPARQKSPRSGIRPMPRQCAPTDKMQAGHFTIDATARSKPVAAAPGMTARNRVRLPIWKPPSRTPRWRSLSPIPAFQPAQPSLRSQPRTVAANPNQKPSSKPQSAPPSHRLNLPVLRQPHSFQEKHP